MDIRYVLCDSFRASLSTQDETKFSVPAKKDTRLFRLIKS